MKSPALQSHACIRSITEDASSGFRGGYTLPRQKGSSADLRTFTVTVDKVEEITGLDFFSSMLQPEQEELERTITVESWDRIKQGW